MDEATELQDLSVFRLKQGGITPSYNDKNLLQGITILVGKDQTLIERNGYTIIDILSDVGGLQGILISGISLLLSILNHNSLNVFLASKHYRSNEVALTTSSQTC